jgi:hypothetical protein
MVHNPKWGFRDVRRVKPRCGSFSNVGACQIPQVVSPELKEVRELNSILFAGKQELEDKLAEESLAKDGENPINFLTFVIRSCPSEL